MPPVAYSMNRGRGKDPQPHHRIQPHQAPERAPQPSRESARPAPGRWNQKASQSTGAGPPRIGGISQAGAEIGSLSHSYGDSGRSCDAPGRCRTVTTASIRCTVTAAARPWTRGLQQIPGISFHHATAMQVRLSQPSVRPNGCVIPPDAHRIWREFRRHGIGGVCQLMAQRSVGASNGRTWRIAWDGKHGLSDEVVRDWEFRAAQSLIF